MASKKPKNATVGERMVLARVRETLGPKTMTLGEFRTREVLKWCRAEAKAHDRAIARAVRKERERCVNIGKLWVASEVHDADMVRALANGDVL